MATSEPSKDIGITTCPICLEEFKTPKCLPCLHNFCETCLNSYIISAFKSESENKVGKSQFNCPVCRRPATPPDPAVKHNEWAKQFPLNHTIVSLMDQSKLIAKVKLCDPCKSMEDDVTAVSWCHECSEALCEMCVNELQATRQRIIDSFDKLHSTFMQKFTQKHNQKVKKLTDSINDIENRDKVIQNCYKLMETCRTRSNQTHVFLEMKKILEREKEQVEELEQILANHKVVEYEFRLDDDIQKLVTRLQTIGQIEVIENASSHAESYPKVHSSVSLNLKECIPELVTSFSVEDKCGVKTLIYGGCFMPDNTLLLSLYDVKKLFLFKSNGDLINQSGDLSGNVYNVCMLDPTTAVVTRCHDKAIDYINIPTLTVKKTVSVGVWCCGITSSDNKLYVGCKGKLLILDKDGKKEKEINTNGDIYGVTIINQREKKIVYTNRYKHSCHFVRSSDLQEIHRFTHPELKNPHGVTSDREGNVYIAGDTSGNVFQLSSEGNLIRVLIQGLYQPRGIQFDGDTDRFFVSYSCPAHIKIYNMIKP